MTPTHDGNISANINGSTNKEFSITTLQDDKDFSNGSESANEKIGMTPVQHDNKSVYGNDSMKEDISITLAHDGNNTLNAKKNFVEVFQVEVLLKHMSCMHEAQAQTLCIEFEARINTVRAASSECTQKYKKLLHEYEALIDHKQKLCT